MDFSRGDTFVFLFFFLIIFVTGDFVLPEVALQVQLVDIC